MVERKMWHTFVLVLVILAFVFSAKWISVLSDSPAHIVRVMGTSLVFFLVGIVVAVIFNFTWNGFVSLSALAGWDLVRIDVKFGSNQFFWESYLWAVIVVYFILCIAFYDSPNFWERMILFALCMFSISVFLTAPKIFGNKKS